MKRKVAELEKSPFISILLPARYRIDFYLLNYYYTQNS